MENKCINNILLNKDKMQFAKYNSLLKSNFYQNQNKNNNISNILIKDLNSNRNKIFENKIYNPNLNSNLTEIKRKSQSNDLRLNTSSDIYEKNINMLNEKIKEQENNIQYLNDRLKNYDTTMEEVTRLNIELNKLNEIIKEKDFTIQEYREITELSKKKFEELLKNKNELIQKIKKLENENNELKNNINDFDNDFNSMKKDLNDIIKENRELKRQLYEKNQKLEHIDNAIEKFDYNRNFKANVKNINYNNLKIDAFKFPENRFLKDKSNINNSKEIKNNYQFLKEKSRTPKNIEIEENDLPYQKFNNFRKEFQLKTEPNNDIIDDIKISYKY